MTKTKRHIVMAALRAYADPYNPEMPCNPGDEVVDACVEFLETFAGLDLNSCHTPAGKTYSYQWLLSAMKQMYGESAPVHCPIQFFEDLGLIRTDLINFNDDEPESEEVAAT